jgi:hypothetical protein
MPAIVLDIETVPTAAALTEPYPEADRQPPANYKSDDAIARWRETDRAAWTAARHKECSLNPRLGRVVAIGTAPADGSAAAVVDLAPTEADEAALLDRWWGKVGDGPARVVTWNGSWDLRFLLVRSIIAGVEISVSADRVASWFRRYTTATHCDVKAVLTNWDVPKAGEGITQWAEAMGLLGKTDGVTGANVAGLVAAGQWDALVAYCGQDVETTGALYRRVGPILDPEFWA